MNQPDNFLNTELRFRTSRSSGKGGQHVNKVETKVELLFNVKNSLLLTREQKTLVLQNLNNRIDENGIFHLTASTERSQWMNKRKAMERFYSLIRRALMPVPVRVRTGPSHNAVENRLKKKKLISEKKSMRRKITGREIE
ncbi:MAG: aminoacyl-tRNA hydrolase [Bacteroidetes bacterium]|nr:aminoacyl-tRNA hydrolase [Bacteroidota bacterium]